VPDLSEPYKRRRSDSQRAMERLRSLLAEIEAKIEDKTLVRARVSDSRIKELASLTCAAWLRRYRAA